jgi:hypothetical protein
MKYFNGIKRFDDLVKNSNLENKKIFGIKVYPLIRRNITSKYLYESKSISSSNHKEIKLRDFYLLSIGILSSFMSLLKIIGMKNKKFLFLGFSRRVIEDNKAVDKFHDPLINTLNHDDCLMFERPFKLAHNTNRITKCDLVDIDFIIYLSILFSVILSPAFMFLYRKDIYRVKQSLHFSFGKKMLSSFELSSTILRFQLEKLFFDLIFKKLKITKLVLTSRWLHYPAIFSARNNGIETIELQHGSILNNNLFYRSFDEGNFYVDHMFTFSEYWNDRDWNVEKVTDIGSGFSNLVDTHKNLGTDKKILIISQPEMQNQLIYDLSLLADANKNMDFYIKLHPQDLDGFQRRYAALLKFNNIVFLDSTLLDLKILLLKFPLVLGYNSTVLFEAYHLGTSVGLLCSDILCEDDYLQFYDLKACKVFHKIVVSEPIDSAFFNRIVSSDILFFKPLDLNFIQDFFYETDI